MSVLRILRWWPVVLTAPFALAQQQPSQRDVAKELERLRARVEALEGKHTEERGADQQRISELESMLRAQEGEAVDAERRRAYGEQVARLQDQTPQQPVATPGFGLAPSAGSSTNLLNPAVTVFLDTGGSISSRGNNKALNRFNLREAEIDFRAAVAPFADGVLIIAIEEEIESLSGGEVEIDRVFALEEGYIDFHTLPGDLSLRIGKFRNAFGVNNLLHTHDLPQVTRPLVVTKFLGPEGLNTTGVSLSWLVPNVWDKYIELRAEIVNADGGEEAPLLGGPNAENPAALAHVKLFDDVGANGTLEIGASYLFARTSDDADFDGHTFGLDATYQWIDPDPAKFRSLIWQSELFWSHNDIDRGPFRSLRNDAFGFYTFGQYQFHRDWYAGLRADYSEFPNSESRGLDDWDFALSPYVSWYITEFLRLRGEYQHRIFKIDNDRRSEEALFLQLTFVFGSHPPHPYWVNR